MPKKPFSLPNRGIFSYGPISWEGATLLRIGSDVPTISIGLLGMFLSSLASRSRSSYVRRRSATI